MLGPLILDLDSTKLTAEEVKLLREPSVGGVILFSRNIEDYSSLTQLLHDIREVRPELLICVDQEGGRVQRCRDGFTRLPPMQVFGRLYEDDPENAVSLATDCGWLLAAELLASGIDFSFAPVLDADANFSSVIGDRAFSADPDQVSELAGAFISGMHEAGMAVTGKHFPGHGSVSADSHVQLPVDERHWNEIVTHDLLPFSRLLPELDAVMPAHILFTQVDSRPVGFSSHWLQGVLRRQMGFKGIIFSDDLTMEGAAFAGGYANRAKAALMAGCDVVLVCNHREGALEVLEMMQAEMPEQHSGLEKMRPARSWNLTDLQASTRWQVTSEHLSQLCPS